jgi:hypothetical protein
MHAYQSGSPFDAITTLMVPKEDMEVKDHFGSTRLICQSAKLSRQNNSG